MPTFLACDVTSSDDWRAAAEEIGATLGQVELLALNAGVMTRSPRDPVDDDPLGLAGSAGYRRVFAVNVDGVVLGLAALRPLLAPGASVVVTASQAGLTPLPFDPFYAMTKHAVVGFVRSMAPPLAAADIRINALCPGGIDTAIVPDPLRAHRARRGLPAARPHRPLVADGRGGADDGGTWLPGDEGTAELYTVPPLR